MSNYSFKARPLENVSINKLYLLQCAQGFFFLELLSKVSLIITTADTGQKRGWYENKRYFKNNRTNLSHKKRAHTMTYLSII